MKNLVLIILSITSLSSFGYFDSSLFDISVDSIYNFDNREFISNSTPTDIQQLSKSVALIFYKNDLIEGQNESTIFGNLLSDKPPVGNNYCPNEKFATHHNYKPACTGFLIGKDILATAGHCFRGSSDCKGKLIAFNVRSDTEVEKGFKIQNTNIYKCVKVISQAYDDETNLIDYSVIKLDRKTSLPVLKVRTKDEINVEENVFMIGHPLGLPQVLSKDATVKDITSDVFFKTTLNSFHGNSGSPVFNTKTHLVEGIMVRGEIDEVYDEVRQCNHYAVYSSSDNDKGEGVTRIKYVIPFIYQ